MYPEHVEIGPKISDPDPSGFGVRMYGNRHLNSKIFSFASIAKVDIQILKLEGRKKYKTEGITA